jgi:hypothetical protein
MSETNIIMEKMSYWQTDRQAVDRHTVIGMIVLITGWWIITWFVHCKFYVGYLSWTDVPTKQRKLCYKLQELQPKYDTSWMGYWTGKILTSFDSKFHFGIYCLFLCVCYVEQELCYKNYKQSVTLSEWDIEQERNWQVSTVNNFWNILNKVNFATSCKKYNQNMTLPEWDIEQERNWQVSTVNSILEYIVYFYAFVMSNKNFDV